MMFRRTAHLLLAALVASAGLLLLAGAGTDREAEAQTRFAIRAVHLRPNNVTSSKMALTVVAATVTAAGTSVTTTANPALVGGQIIGYTPSGNQDQLVDNVTLNGSGSVVVTLAAAATANNTFNVYVLRPQP